VLLACQQMCLTLRRAGMRNSALAQPVSWWATHVNPHSLTQMLTHVLILKHGLSHSFQGSKDSKQTSVALVKYSRSSWAEKLHIAIWSLAQQHTQVPHTAARTQGHMRSQGWHTRSSPEPTLSAWHISVTSLPLKEYLLLTPPYTAASPWGWEVAACCALKCCACLLRRCARMCCTLWMNPSRARATRYLQQRRKQQQAAGNSTTEAAVKGEAVRRYGSAAHPA
jgi:hypothetical protein